MGPLTLDAALRAVSPRIARILERALEGRAPSREEAVQLAEEGSTGALAAVADEVRRARVGEVVTYVVNRNINFTNVCTIGCRFCAFCTDAASPDAYHLSLDQIAAKAVEARAAGATEVCVQGGLSPVMDGGAYRDILRAIRRAAPALHIHAFSPMEVLHGARTTGMPLGMYLDMLKDEGLDSLPGTAAEILDDDLRRVISPRKLTVADWVAVIATAHRHAIPTSATMMYGHVETATHWVSHLCLLRELQGATGGFTEFVPLGFVHANTRLFREDGAAPGARSPVHLRVHALARLVLQGAIDNVQASWVKLDRALSQRCLQAGANDYGGTLMEESISRLAGATTGEYLAPEEFRRRIRELGRVPAQRTTTYELLRVFPTQPGCGDVGGRGMRAESCEQRAWP